MRRRLAKTGKGDDDPDVVAQFEVAARMVAWAGSTSPGPRPRVCPTTMGAKMGVPKIDTLFRTASLPLSLVPEAWHVFDQSGMTTRGGVGELCSTSRHVAHQPAPHGFNRFSCDAPISTRGASLATHP